VQAAEPPQSASQVPLWQDFPLEHSLSFVHVLQSWVVGLQLLLAHAASALQPRVQVFVAASQ
jgi:hypothetical protein